MNSEGVELVSQVALVAIAIFATAVLRTWAGPSKARNVALGVGTIGGMATGIAAASLISKFTATDVSVVFACLGIVTGWSIAVVFGHRFPRQAN